MKIPSFFTSIFTNQTWNVKNNKNEIYLTFDDGPIPEVTPWVLDILKEYNITATFFCIGDNIRKHPEVFKRILEEGHQVGNHTFNHLNGWKTSTVNYKKNVTACTTEIEKHTALSTRLIRPPYGRITPSQIKALQKENYQIIMWEILSRDYDTHLDKDKCYQNATKNVRSGSIIVFHDSLKAEERLRYALPKTIKFLKEKGFKFGKL